MVGLFASLGYYVGDGRFGTEDDARRVAPTLARLCCYAPEPEAWDGVMLPQGAAPLRRPFPTSSVGGSMPVSRALPVAIRGAFTRYADDLTFSFKDPSLDLRRFRWWVDQVCHQEGFLLTRPSSASSGRRSVNCGKDRGQRRAAHSARGAATLPARLLHNCRRHGGVPSLAGRDPGAYLRGFASYVHMVYPDEGAEFLRQVDELLGPEAGAPEETA